MCSLLPVPSFVQASWGLQGQCWHLWRKKHPTPGFRAVAVSSLTPELLVAPRWHSRPFRAGALDTCSELETQDDLAVNLPWYALSAFSVPSPPGAPFVLSLIQEWEIPFLSEHVKFLGQYSCEHLLCASSSAGPLMDIYSVYSSLTP